MSEIKVGMEVWIKAIGNQERLGRMWYRASVAKVGRKYFEVGGGIYSHNLKFDLESLRQATNYTPDWKIYFSEQEVLDDNEMQDLTIKLGRFFSSHKLDLTLEQMRAIDNIISRG